MRRIAIAIAAVAAVAIGAEVALLDALEAGELLAGVERNQRHTLRRAPHLAELRHAGTDQHAAGGDQHHLVVVVDQHGADHLAVPLRGLDRDHALAAAAVARIFAERRALAEPVLGGGEHALAFVGAGEHADHALLIAEAHAAHAGRLPAHRSHVALLEAHRLAIGSEKHDIAFAIRRPGTNEIVALVDAHRDDAARSRSRK